MSPPQYPAVVGEPQGDATDVWRVTGFQRRDGRERPAIAAARKTYAALWTATAVGAAGAAAADVAVLDVGAPHDDPQATIATAIGLLAGNALVTLWRSRWPRSPGTTCPASGPPATSWSAGS